MLFPRWGREVRYGEEQGGHRCYIVKSLLVRGHIARSPTTALLCFAAAGGRLSRPQDTWWPAGLPSSECQISYSQATNASFENALVTNNDRGELAVSYK